jgi:signal transduction histidine kinase/CheY-like chemotaxis protein
MQKANSASSRVLVCAPIGRDASASAELLRRAGVPAEVCADLAEIVQGIQAGAAAVFVAEEALFGQDLSPLLSWVERQPPWSDLPFVVLTSRQEQAAVADWRKRLITSLRNVSLLERPVQGITLVSALQAAVRARLRQYELRGLLQARERAAQELESLVVARTAELEQANRELRREMTERARIEANLHQAQKMEAIGQLTGGVAHDFNNLLTVISGGLEVLDRQTDARRRQRLIDGMQQATQRGARLTRQLLAFSRHQSLTAERIDLVRQVGAMRDLLDRSLGGEVRVQLELAKDLWAIEADPGELELAVLNLAVNARDAMPDGGTIVIRAENAPLPQDGELVGDFVRLSVIDSGSGIPAEVKDRVFEPFFTTKDIGKGSGLGLPQVYGFAKQSGGMVQIDSEPGQGTNVTLLLPRSMRQPAAIEAQPSDPETKQPVRRSAGCVLLVEDDDDVAALVAEMLEQIGYDVLRAPSATAALAMLANGRAVDIVFSYVMMPGGMNGVDLARELRRRRPGLPVLLTSGYSDAFRKDADAECLRVLPKPFAVDALAAALSSVRT